MRLTPLCGCEMSYGAVTCYPPDLATSLMDQSATSWTMTEPPSRLIGQHARRNRSPCVTCIGRLPSLSSSRSSSPASSPCRERWGDLPRSAADKLPQPKSIIITTGSGRSQFRVHSRPLDYLTARSAVPRTADIGDRPGMSEQCGFRTISDMPKVNLAHPAGLAYRLPDNQ